MIDIHRARQRKILPLAAMAGEASAHVLAELAARPPLPSLEDAPPFRQDTSVGEDAPVATQDDRLTRWRKRLLDLSGRNRLLNLPTSGATVLPIDCPDAGVLEDVLAGMRSQPRAAPLRFRPWPDLMDGLRPAS